MTFEYFVSTPSMKMARMQSREATMIEKTQNTVAQIVAVRKCCRTHSIAKDDMALGVTDATIVHPSVGIPEHMI